MVITITVSFIMQNIKLHEDYRAETQAESRSEPRAESLHILLLILRIHIIHTNMTG